MRTSHKFVVLFLLVCLGLQGGIAYSAQTGLGGLDIDPSTDDNVAATTTVVSVKDTSGSNHTTVDGAGDTNYLETGGSASDPDFNVDGYATFDGASGTVNFLTPSTVASASNLDIGTGNFITITGTTEITNIETTDTWAGRLIALKFEGSLTVREGQTGANLLMAGNFSATADDTLVLFCYDGLNWNEIDRSNN